MLFNYGATYYEIRGFLPISMTNYLYTGLIKMTTYLDQRRQLLFTPLNNLSRDISPSLTAYIEKQTDKILLNQSLFQLCKFYDKSEEVINLLYVIFKELYKDHIDTYTYPITTQDQLQSVINLYKTNRIDIRQIYQLYVNPSKKKQMDKLIEQGRIQFEITNSLRIASDRKNPIESISILLDCLVRYPDNDKKYDIVKLLVTKTRELKQSAKHRG
jgi:hypothetical protein